jgi:sialidase-1
VIGAYFARILSVSVPVRSIIWAKVVLAMKQDALHWLASGALVLAACGWHVPPILASEGVEETDVYVKGQDGYHTYRIPSVIAAADGSLLAFCEGRKSGGGDSGDIDMLLKRSTDGGRHWSAQQIVWNDGPNTCGNPCPVVDRPSGKVWLLLTHNLGQDREPQIIERKSRGTRTVWVSSSADNGHSWSAPVEITDSTKASDWTWYATGPGAGIQLTRGPHAGRLVVPCDHIEAGTKHYYSHVIFSDDHGRSWQRGGSTPNHEVNECEVVELSDGRLLLNMRNYDRGQRTRQIAYSSDGGATWHDQRHDAALVEPICQASIRRIAWPEGNKPGLIVFSNPASEVKRMNLTIRASLDEGETWPIARQLYARSSAYSCLVALPDGQIGCLYEADNYSRIVFARFSRDWLTGNGAAAVKSGR